MARISTARALHELGLAVWCGGSLMGAVSLNGAAATLEDPAQRGRAVNAGWTRWAPINAAAIGAHLVGGALIVRENRSRVASQRGVAGWTGVKAGLTGAAVAVSAATAWYSSKVWKEGDVPLAGGTEPTGQTPPDAAQAVSRLKALQWATPALTAAIVVANSVMGEQQRPAEIARGTVERGAQAALAGVRHPGTAAAALGRLL